MLIFENAPDAAITRRSLPTPETPQPDPAAEPRPLTLTCLEAPSEFEKLRAGAYQEFAPKNYYRRCLADEVVEELWMKRRVSAVANQALSIQIEKDFDQVSATHPNADPALRTVLAWHACYQEPSARFAFTDRDRRTRTLLGLSRYLSSISERK